MQGLTFRLSGSRMFVMVSAAVLDHFVPHIQIGCRKEAGGQLFGTFPAPHLMRVEKATGPGSAYKRLWRRISFNLRSDQKEIDSEFEQGMHYLGDWHTHPSRIPLPSSMDIKTFRSRFRESTHELNEILMIIVGTDHFPQGLWVGLQNQTRVTQLHPNPESS